MTDQSTAPQPKSDEETQESVAIPDSEEELEGLPAKILEKISSKILEKNIGNNFSRVHWAHSSASYNETV